MHKAIPSGQPGDAPADSAHPASQQMSRRECISALGLAAGGLALAVPAITETATPSEAAPLPYTVAVDVRVNSIPHRLRIDPRVTLLDLLREQLHLTGTKKGCDHGQCGACTVLVNGRRINSCLSLAASHSGDDVTTVEGIAPGGVLEPIQTEFIEQDGFQCGYCTPGQICSAVAALAEARRGDASFVTRDVTRLAPIELTDEEIRERMSGNICRCGAYPGIVAALKSAVKSMQHATRTKESGR